MCLPYYCHFFWLASLASIIQTYYIYTYFQVQCSVLNGHPFSNIPLIQIMKRIQLPISCFYERAFSYFSRLKLHDFTPFKSKILWEEPPDPPLSTIHLQYQKILCHVICVVVFCFVFFLFFFLLVKNFRKVGPPPPPPDENSWIRAWNCTIL